MITKSAYILVRKLVHNKIIREENADLFVYGFWIVLSNLFCFLEVVLFGMIFGMLLESILFYFTFVPLRGYAGGVHARKEITCIFCTTFAMFFSVIGIRQIEAVGGFVVHTGCIIFGTLAILLLSPLDSDAKPLDRDERRHFRNISFILTGTIDAIAAFAYCLSLDGLFAAVAVAILLEGTLLVTGRINEMNFCSKMFRVN